MFHHEMWTGHLNSRCLMLHQEALCNSESQSIGVIWWNRRKNPYNKYRDNIRWVILAMNYSKACFSCQKLIHSSLWKVRGQKF